MERWRCDPLRYTTTAKIKGRPFFETTFFYRLGGPEVII